MSLSLSLLPCLALHGCLSNFVSMGLRAKRAEAPANVDGIRTAELAYDAAYDGFAAALPQPQRPEEVDKLQIEWPQGAGGFETIGWRPDGMVRGSYWVEVSADGQDFTVHAVIDVDGDGERAHYTATRDETATLITDDDVW